MQEIDVYINIKIRKLTLENLEKQLTGLLKINQFKNHQTFGV